MSLDNLRQLITQLEAATGDEDFDGLAFLDEKIAEVSERIARSRRFLKTLREARDALSARPVDHWVPFAQVWRKGAFPCQSRRNS